MSKAIVEHVAFPVQVVVQPHVLFHVVQIARIHAVGKRYGNIIINQQILWQETVT